MVRMACILQKADDEIQIKNDNASTDKSFQKAPPYLIAKPTNIDSMLVK